MYNKNFVAAVLCFFFLTYFAAEARSQHAIPRSVLSNGGTVMSNGAYRVMSTLGQSAIGYAVNGTHAHGAGFWYQNVDIATSVESASDETLPATFRLDQNYPNPFNPSTTIQFGVPIKSAVSLKLFDLLGREVAELVRDEMPAGEYKINFQAKGLASGVYLYRMVAKGVDGHNPNSTFVEIRKFTLLK